MAQVRNLEGVSRIAVDRVMWTLRVEYDPTRTDLARIQSAIDAAADAADAHD